MRIISRLALFLTLGLVASSCVQQQAHVVQSPEAADSLQEIRRGEAHFALLLQRHGGVWSLDPELGAYVNGVGLSLARLSDRGALDWEFVVLNASWSGAWALPGGKVAVTRGLLVRLDDEAELAALFLLAIDRVLQPANLDADASRIERSKRRPIAIGTLFPDSPWYEITLLDEPRPLEAPTPPAQGESSAVDATVLRRLERSSYDPLGLERLLRRVCDPASAANRDDSNIAIDDCSAERAEAVRRLAQKSPPGASGRARFQEATRRLRRDTMAYEAYARGLDALLSHQDAAALAAAREALRLQPREAQFQELLAVAAWRQGRPALAFAALNRAIALAPGFFRPHLLRGLLHLVHGNLEPASEDLLAANRLLPSVEATLGLAEVARGLGDEATARERYAEIAAGHSVAAVFARRRIEESSGAPPLR